MRSHFFVLALSLFTAITSHAAQARPRMELEAKSSPLSSAVQLALPRPLSEIADESKPGRHTLGIDLEAIENGDEISKLLKTVEHYVSYRRKRSSMRRGAMARDFCPKAESDTAKFLCAYEANRTAEKIETSTSNALSKSERAQLAGALLSENWDAAIEIPYQSVVGSVGRIESKIDLLHIGRSLASKRDCVGVKAATAIGYQLEVHFPETDAVDTAKALYTYSSECGTDFASAKAAYRLALIDIWQNQCGPVPELMKKVELNSEANQFHSRAKYWRAYCAEVTGRSDESRNAREALLFEHPMTFHNLAANGQSERAINWILRETSAPISFRSLIREDLNTPIRAVEALIHLNAPELAAELIDKNISLFNQAESEVRLYLAAVMHRAKQPLIKFKVLSKLFQDSPRMVSADTMRLYFPMRYFEFIKSKAEQLDPLLVTALIRQESAFNSNARSRVGARGLMQLMPATARTLSSVRTSRLFDPLTNIGLGTQYLRKRLSQYGGDVELTLAAYNAGIGKVDEWKKRYPTDNKILFLDLIPYRETRDYVASILRNYFWYTKLYGHGLLEEAKLADLNSALERKPASVLPAVYTRQPIDSTIQAILRADAGLAAKPGQPTEN